MAWIKSIMFITLLITIIATSQVKARGSNGVNVPRNNEHIANFSRSITNITGKVPCFFHHDNGTVHSTPANVTAPPFAHAVVELKCRNNITLATAITNIEGLFTMMINPLQAILATILSDCTLSVATPLTTCNPNATPGGRLVSALQFIEHIIRDLLRISIVIPVGFEVRVGG